MSSYTCEVLIPTCKPPRLEQVREIERNTPEPLHLVVSSIDASAAANRNWCLDESREQIAVMLDDDVSGFYPGWYDDLVRPIRNDPMVLMVSARLMTPDGLVAPTCSRCYDLEPDEIEVQPNSHCVIPTAAIAFRNLRIRFDETFKGSGFEDNDWCFEHLRQMPGGRFIQSNRCKLIHANEQKAQAPHWTFNRDYFYWKWRNVDSPAKHD